MVWTVKINGDSPTVAHLWFGGYSKFTKGKERKFRIIFDSKYCSNSYRPPNSERRIILICNELIKSITTLIPTLGNQKRKKQRRFL